MREEGGGGGDRVRLKAFRRVGLETPVKCVQNECLGWREGVMEGGRDGGREGGMEGRGRERRRKGKKEGGMEGGKEGEREVLHIVCVHSESQKTQFS